MKILALLSKCLYILYDKLTKKHKKHVVCTVFLLFDKTGEKYLPLKSAQCASGYNYTNC